MSKPGGNESGWIVMVDPQALSSKNNKKTSNQGAARLAANDPFNALKNYGKVLHDTSVDYHGRRLSAATEPIIMLLNDQQLKDFKQEFGGKALIKDPIPNFEVSLDPVALKQFQPENLAQSSEAEIAAARTSAAAVQAGSAASDYAWHIDFTDSAANSGILDRSPNDGAGVDIYIGDTGTSAIPGEFNMLPGKSFIDGEPTTEDLNGHGTSSASCAAGRTYGVAPGANVIPVKVLAKSGTGPVSGIIEGISWIAKHHRDRVNAGASKSAVVNLSISVLNDPIFGVTPNVYDEMLAVFKDLVRGNDLIVTGAAGNYRDDGCNYLPSGINSDGKKPKSKVPNIINVGAIDIDGSLSGFTNFGACINIYAPGTKIPTITVDRSGKKIFHSFDGTSAASPVTGGVVAKAMADNPDASASTINSQILKHREMLNAVLDQLCNDPGSTSTIPVLRSAQKPLTELAINPATIPLSSPPQLVFKQLSDNDFAACSFDVTLPNAKNAECLDVAILSAELPTGLQSFKDTVIMCKDPFNARFQTLPITKSGSYWVKYRRENGKNMLDVGSGSLIGKNLMQSYNLDTNSLFSASQLTMNRFAFGMKDGTKVPVTISNFKGFGNLGSKIDAPTPQTTQAPSHKNTRTPTNAVTKRVTNNPTDRATLQPTPQPIEATAAPTNKIKNPPTKKSTTKKTQNPTTERTNAPVTFTPTTKAADPDRIKTLKPTWCYYSSFTPSAINNAELTNQIGDETYNIMVNGNAVSVTNSNGDLIADPVDVPNLATSGPIMFKTSNNKNQISVSIIPNTKPPKPVELFSLENPDNNAVTVGFPNADAKFISYESIQLCAGKTPRGKGRQLSESTKAPSSLEQAANSAAMLMSTAGAALSSFNKTLPASTASTTEEANSWSWQVLTAGAMAMTALGALGAAYVYSRYMRKGSQGEVDSVLMNAEQAKVFEKSIARYVDQNREQYGV